MPEQTEQPMTAAPSPTEVPSFSSQERIPMMVVVWGEMLGCGLALIANPLTIGAIINYKLLKKSVSNLFILSLCISDFVFGANYLVVKVIHLLQLHGFLDDDVLRVISWATSAMVDYCYFEGLLGIILIGVDRALATAKPLSHRRLVTLKKGLVVILFAWVYNWLITFPPIISNVKKFKSLSAMPVLHQPAGALPTPYIQGFITPYIMSIFIICAIVYGLVVIFYFRAKRRTNVHSDSSKQKAQRMTKMVIAIVGVLIISNSPLVVMAAISFAVPMNQMWHLTLYEVSQFLSLLGISINNFMYAWHIDYYKVAYMKLLSCYKVEFDTNTRTAINTRTSGGKRGTITNHHMA